jgi:hypothetical protein
MGGITVILRLPAKAVQLAAERRPGGFLHAVKNAG